MTTVAELHTARADFAAWQRTDENAAHDRDPRRVRVMRIVAAERVRLIEQLLAIGMPTAEPSYAMSSVDAAYTADLARDMRRCVEAAPQGARQGAMQAA